MEKKSKAGSDGASLDPLADLTPVYNQVNGVVKTTVHEEMHEEDVAADDLARRMAASRVRRAVIQHKCSEPCSDPKHDEEMGIFRELLEILGLPEVYELPTDEEKATLLARLPRPLAMDTRAPDHHLVPERRGYAR